MILDLYPVGSKVSEPKVWYTAVQKKFLSKMGTSLSDHKWIWVDMKFTRHVNMNFKFLEEFPGKLLPTISTDIFMLHNDGHELWTIMWFMFIININKMQSYAPGIYKYVKNIIFFFMNFEPRGFFFSFFSDFLFFFFLNFLVVLVSQIL